jgi:hypothetical protein
MTRSLVIRLLIAPCIHILYHLLYKLSSYFKTCVTGLFIEALEGLSDG